LTWRIFSFLLLLFSIHSFNFFRYICFVLHFLLNFLLEFCVLILNWKNYFETLYVQIKRTRRTQTYASATLHTYLKDLKLQLHSWSTLTGKRSWPWDQEGQITAVNLMMNFDGKESGSESWNQITVVDSCHRYLGSMIDPQSLLSWSMEAIKNRTIRIKKNQGTVSRTF
jgi:hypothetical protein